MDAFTSSISRRCSSESPGAAAASLKAFKAGRLCGQGPRPVVALPDKLPVSIENRILRIEARFKQLGRFYVRRKPYRMARLYKNRTKYSRHSRTKARKQTGGMQFHTN